MRGAQSRPTCLFAPDDPDAARAGNQTTNEWRSCAPDDYERCHVCEESRQQIQFAANLDIRGFKLKSPQFGDGVAWADIAHALVDLPRTARIQRNTKETRIEVDVDLDREADPDVSTGLGFYDHMLEQLGKHGGFALRLRREGEL